MDDMLQNQNHNLRKNHTRNRQDIQDLNRGPFRIHPQGHPQGQLQGHPQGQLHGHLQDLPISHIKRSQNQNIGRGSINMNTVHRQGQGHPDLGQCQGRINPKQRIGRRCTDINIGRQDQDLVQNQGHVNQREGQGYKVEKEDHTNIICIQTLIVIPQ